MARPLDVITAAHNAFRAEIAVIDRGALRAARGERGLDATVERFWRMNEVLAWHAYGEEADIFPAIERVAPDVAASYELDHRGLDAAFDTLRGAVTVHDPLETARATAAFRFHLSLHLDKEERHLYVLFEERLSDSDQQKAVRGMVSSDPRERAEFIDWLFRRIDDDDREKVLRYWHSVMPADGFAHAIEVVRSATGEAFARTAARIPELPVG